MRQMMASLSTKKYITDFLYHLSHNHSEITTHHKNHDIFLMCNFPINPRREVTLPSLYLSSTSSNFARLVSIKTKPEPTVKQPKLKTFNEYIFRFFLFCNIFERREDAFLCVARESVLKGIAGLFSILKSDMF